MLPLNMPCARLLSTMIWTTSHQGRWAPGLASSVINAYTAKNRRPRQYQHEPPPFDLRRFSAPRLHPKTRAAGLRGYARAEARAGMPMLWSAP